MTKKLSIILPLLGVILIAVWVNVSARKIPHEAPLVTPVSSPFEHSIAATGIVEASDRNYNLAPPIPGQLTQLFVHENDVVHTGDKLYQIDNRQQTAAAEAADANVAKSRAGLATAEANVNTQLANLNSAKSNVDSAKAAYVDAEQIASRNEGLHKEGIIADQAYTTANNSRDGAKARLGQAEAQVAQAQAQLVNAQALLSQQRAELEAAIATAHQQHVALDMLTVRAPADGKILQVNNRAGEYLASNAATSPVLFGNTGSLLIRVDVDEINASHIKPGTHATAALKGDSSRRFPLQFVRIIPYMVPKQSLTGSNSERVDVRVLQIEYRFDPPPFPVYVGQQVDVYIDRAEN